MFLMNQINENIRKVMKTYNPQLQQQQLLLQQQLQQIQGDSEENPTVAIERLKKELIEAEESKDYCISYIKMALLSEILPHLKIKHGINEFSTAEWYADSFEEWTKQYCILLWDEKGLAKPQYWCNSGCAVCKGLFEKYDTIITPLDQGRLKALHDIREKKRQLANEIQKEKAQKEIILAQQQLLNNNNPQQQTKQKKK